MYIILFILLIIPGIIATHIYLKDSCETNFFNIVYQIAKFTYAIMFISFSVQIASPNGHLCHIRRPLCDLIGGQLGTH